MELSGKRVGIFVEKMYQEFEFWYPYFRMKEAGAKVSIIGTGAKEYPSLNGLPAPGGLSFKSVNDLVNADAVSAADFDAIIIPGGKTRPFHPFSPPCFGPVLPSCCP